MRNLTISALIALVLFPASHHAIAEDRTYEYDIVIPKFQVRDQRSEEIFDYLRELSVKHDKRGRGIDLVNMTDQETRDRKLTLNLRKKRVSQILDLIAPLLGVWVQYDGPRVIIRNSDNVIGKGEERSK